MSEVILFLLLIGVVVSFLFAITSDRPGGNLQYSSVTGVNGSNQSNATKSNKILNLLELVKFKDVPEEPAIKAAKPLVGHSSVATINPPSPPPSTLSLAPRNQPTKATALKNPGLTVPLDLSQANPPLPPSIPLLKDSTQISPKDGQDKAPNIFSVKNGLNNPIIPSEASVLPRVDFDNEPISTKALQALQRGLKDKNQQNEPKFAGPIPLAPLSALNDRNEQGAMGNPPEEIEVDPLNLNELESLPEREQIDRIMDYLQQTGKKDETNYQATITQLQQLYYAQYQKLKQLEIQQENPSWEMEQVSKELEHERQQLGDIQQQLDFTTEEKQFLFRENSNLKLRLNKSEQAQTTLENDLVKTKQRLNLIAIIATVVITSGLGIALVLNHMGPTIGDSQENDEPAALEN
ncbi:MAG: DNA replication initiation control protein YabA [Synechococcaceae cyanobacterium RL_1_2]|nr:DNA replication initiation control protein YabA [Synechococcaceae cyanobacterium RL_1_2]